MSADRRLHLHLVNCHRQCGRFDPRRFSASDLVNSAGSDHHGAMASPITRTLVWIGRHFSTISTAGSQLAEIRKLTCEWNGAGPRPRAESDHEADEQIRQLTISNPTAQWDAAASSLCSSGECARVGCSELTGGGGQAEAWADGTGGGSRQEEAAMTMVHSAVALSPCLRLAFDLLVAVAD